MRRAAVAPCSPRVRAPYLRSLTLCPLATICSAVPHVPNPLAFLSYVFCFTTFFAGPSFEYSEYEAGVKETHFPKRAGTHVKDLQVKSRILVTLKRFALGVMFVGIMTVGKPIFNITDFIDPKNGIHSAPFYARVVFAWLSLMMVRMKYYFAWSWSEGSANLAGFGYVAHARAASAARLPTYHLSRVCMLVRVYFVRAAGTAHRRKIGRVSRTLTPLALSCRPASRRPRSAGTHRCSSGSRAMQTSACRWASIRSALTCCPRFGTVRA
ncbi:hypothetical protein EON66_05910, partial [archaeon]